MRNIFITALILTTVWMTSAAVVIAMEDSGKDHPKDAHSGPLAQIDLSKAQTEAIMKIRLNHEKNIAPLRIKGHQLNSELDILWLEMTPDIEKIRSVQKEIHTVKFQILEKRTEFRMAMREVMTKDQLSRFLALGGGRCQGPDKPYHRLARANQAKMH